MAMHESGAQTIEGDENEWVRRLRTLTRDFPKDEPSGGSGNRHLAGALLAPEKVF
jgi:hypothetical protein